MGKRDYSIMHRWLDRVLWIGPVALVITAFAWSVLDSEFSTDTWMGLAAGRQLSERLDWTRFQETFPRQDSFSYPFFGQTWFNHNWLSNLGQYWVYDRVGPSAVVYVTWAIAACIQALVLLATYWRTESWLAGFLAAALVGIGTRDFLEPRAAIVGLLCLAALWALICALEGQHDRRRWWPIVLLLPLLVFWGSAHGGFVLGYGILAFYVGHWAATRLFRARRFGIALLVVPIAAAVLLLAAGASLPFIEGPGWSRWLPVALYAVYGWTIRRSRSNLAVCGPQILCILVVLVTAMLATIRLDPFGIESFTHSGRIAASTVFRSISEWHPAYSHVADLYPPMWRFWMLCAFTGGGIFLLWLAGKVVGPVRAASDSRTYVPPWTVFDVALVLGALGLTIWARRFAPLFYVLSAPLLPVWAMHLGNPLMPYLRGYGSSAVKAGALLIAVVIGWTTWTKAQRELIEAFRDQPATGILERTRGNLALDDVLTFLEKNQVRVNLLADYGDGASVTFRAPLARVFIDGRSDQLFTEQHFKRYWTLMDGRARPVELRAILDETETNAVLLRARGGSGALQDMLLYAPDWALLFVNRDYLLFLRRQSQAFEQLRDRTTTGTLWHPLPVARSTPEAQISSALVLVNTSRSDHASSLAMLEAAVDHQPALGRILYPTITRSMAETSGKPGATEYIRLQTMRVRSNATLEPRTRATLLATLAESRSQIELTDSKTHTARQPSERR